MDIKDMIEDIKSNESLLNFCREEGKDCYD